LFQLVGECRELGDDPILWRQHLGAGLGRLTGAGMAIVAEIGPCVRKPRQDLGTVAWGWENGFNQAGWLHMLAEFHRDPMHSPLMNAYIARLPGQAGECLSRTDLVSDAEWRRAEDYLLLYREVRADATLVCFRAIPAASDEYSEIFMVRGIGVRDFSARAKAQVAEAHAILGPLVGASLARFHEPSPSELPPRVRQVLKCLLEGDSDKQAAARLGLGRHTVNQYTKAIFAHFRVRSRAELLARWLRRGWSNQCAWADGN
jgi:DNA-binding CsgD family transcriptional regulator